MPSGQDRAAAADHMATCPGAPGMLAHFQVILQVVMWSGSRTDTIRDGLLEGHVPASSLRYVALSTQERFVESTIDRQDLSCRFGQPVTDEEKGGFGLVTRCDRRPGQGPIGVE